MSIRLVAYLNFDGQSREAVEFYKQVFDAEIMGIMTFGEMPADPNMPMPDSAKDRVAHAMLKVGDTELMFSDTFPGQSIQPGSQMSICIVSADAERSRKIFDALAEGGNVTMPLQETFWSPAYGMVTDKFGVPFQISTDAKQ